MQKLMKRVLKLFGLMLLSGGLLMVFCAWQVYDYAQNKKPLPKKADAVVVLGAASPVLRERINYGIKLYQQHTVQKMIFTGGTPKFGYPTEAEVAQRYAMQKFNVPQRDIILDTESSSTYENLTNTRTLMHNHHLDSVIIVSDPDHLARAAAMARALGITANVSATPSSLYYGQRKARLKFMLQETLSLTYFYLENGLMASAKILLSATVMRDNNIQAA